MSENGWINNSLGFEWLQEIFEKYTSSQTASDYHLLMLDGYSSHATASFNYFYLKKRIISLYIPFYLSHLLQPLDISYFTPLKQYYSQRIREIA